MSASKLAQHGMRLEPWTLIYDGFDPRLERTREALCTLGNGRFATRGASSDVLGADDTHYPGTYAAGVYDRLETEVHGKVIPYEELVNLPNWLPVRILVDGTPLSLASAQVLSYRTELDLAHGVLRRSMRLEDRQGRRFRLREQRIVHMETHHLAALRLRIEPESWTGALRLESWIDGRVTNTNAGEYEGLDRRHLEHLGAHAGEPGCRALRVRTRQSRIELAMAMRSELHGLAPAAWEVLEDDARTGVARTVSCRPGESIELTKVVALHTSRDPTCSEPLTQALRAVHEAPSFDALRESHERAWRRRWARFDIALPHHHHATTTLRVHAFHLLQTFSSASVDLDVGIPACGLHGENYHGHAFWDDLFVFPVLNLRWPELARALLMYRVRRLPAARARAREHGYRGAMFPWRSASDGREVTDPWRRNPRSGRWIADHSILQRHINAAIAYNVCHYQRISDDAEFMIDHGAELLLSIAQFWSSAAEHDAGDGRYHLRGVVGPDEFHDAYPGSERPGIDDNAYTNVMAVWCLQTALAVLPRLPSDERALLLAKLGIDDAELARWRDLTHRMFVPIHADGVIEQFRGFDQLAPFPFRAYEARYGNIQRVDNILEQEGDSPNRYQVCKQADVLMLFYLLSEQEVRALLERLGYRFEEGALARNVHHYASRTSHGSTLSRVVYAWVLTRLDRPRSWQALCEALGSDLADVQMGSTQEGVHIGAMAGTIDVFQRAYLGLEMRDDCLFLAPRLPPELNELCVALRYRGLALQLRVDHECVHIAADGGDGAIALHIAGAAYTITPGSARTVPLRASEPGEQARLHVGPLAGDDAEAE